MPLKQVAGEIIEITNNALKNNLLISTGRYFDHRDHHIAGMVFAGVLSIAIYFGMGGFLNNPLFWVGSFLYIISFVLVWNAIKCYTQSGKILRDEVEGFKLFLVTTEQERLKFTSTPPVRTPQLYEKYLPYAVALGVEKQWTAQFAPIFDQLKQQGVVYVNQWYIRDLHQHTANLVPSNLGSTLCHCISTSSPGSSSGSGGSGSSGGGGGGGGGGAW